MHSPRGDRHGWNSLDHDLSIHESILDEFREFFIIETNLRTRLFNEDTLTIRGRIFCQGNLYLDVFKILELNHRNQVRTYQYSYQACINAAPSRRIFRYDNAHTYAREGHADPHHKHTFDPRTGVEVRSSPQWVGHEGWPTLADVLTEIHEWHPEIGQHLPGEPDPVDPR